MATVHIYGPSSYNSVRVRTWCPAHDKNHLATVTSYYDGWNMSFDCGAYVYSSEGYWIPDRKGHVHSKYHPNTGRARQITEKQWAHWQPKITGWLNRIPSERDWFKSIKRPAPQPGLGQRDGTGGA